ncbi:MAG: ATP-binding cassette domain-containing protein [Bacteroidales bacterium]|nr:ATP-binding cassette domain-containing protein [Candidatus Cryptobacteroides onthequi]
MITISNLGFSYGSKTVLRNISLNLEQGKIYGLLGENGVGKTTLLTLLAGLKKVQEGSIMTDGECPYSRKPSFLGNQFFLPDDIYPYNSTAADYAKVTGQFWPEFSYEKFLEIMKEFETDPSMKMNKMSTGQLKKAYISFALACNTRYLFLDEPTNGLDIPSKTQFRKAITRYTSEDSTIVISTHQVRDLENIIDPIIILDSQDVLLNASLEEISQKLYFDYGNMIDPGALYSEQLPGGFIQVAPNASGEESKVNIEALFNTVYRHKELIKELFKK